MNRFHSSFQEHARTAELSAGERARMRARLDRAMRERPAPVPSPFFNAFSFTGLARIASPRAAYAFAAIVLIIGITGGTAYAAEGSVPGDALYAIKVGVNEPVALALAVTPASKAATHAAIATDRISEAETLAAHGALTASTSAALAASFDQNVSDIATITDSIAATDTGAASVIRDGLSRMVAARASALLAVGDTQDSGVRSASGDLVRAVVASTITDDRAATSTDAGEIAIASAPADAAASAATPAPASVPRAFSLMKSAAPAVPASSDVSPDVSSAVSSDASSTETVSVLSATESTSVISPAVPISPVVSSAITSTGTAVASSLLHVSLTPEPTLSDLTDAIDNAQAHFDAASSTLDASTTAYVQDALANAQLLPVQVQADAASGDDEAMRADLERSLARIARLESVITATHHRRGG